LVSFIVATYNVHKNVGLDRRSNPGRIGGVIRELHADVIGLQEMDNRSDGTHESAQMDYLAEETGYEAVPGPTIKRSNGHYGNVLLTHWPVLQKREMDLCLSCREPRGTIDAILSVNERWAGAIVTHFGLAGAERGYRIGRIMEFLWECIDPLIVFLGDMREWFPLSWGLRQIHQRLGRSPAFLSFPSRRPFLALDRIWVRPNQALKRIWSIGQAFPGWCRIISLCWRIFPFSDQF
jgi:endonuclease/exonuclease/phosphatase family metal-dependent hydrolase